MSKKKRIRRDIEKYERSGRYWDLLRLMESEDLVSANAAAYREAWNNVIRQALQRERSFEEFFREVGTLRSVPKDPDCLLLMYLKEFIGDGHQTEKLMALKGLSPHAERLRSKVIAFASSGVQEEKLRGLLDIFIREPGKITGRYYEQVAPLVPVKSLRTSISQLGESINAVRRLNLKQAVDGGWNAIDPSKLNRIDSRLERISRAIPQSLLDVLLYPYIHNLAVMCLRLAPDIGVHQASRLLDSIPFLLPRLAGDKFDKVKQKLLADRNEPYEDDLDSLRQKVAELSIEDKLTMLRDLRLKTGDSQAGGMDLDDLGFDDDDDYYEDDDSGMDFRDECEDRESGLARKLLLMHQAVIKEISVRTSGMPLREKKELVRIMEPVLFRDLDFIVDMTGTPELMVELLSAAMSAGCAGVRTGLLALLAGTSLRMGNVRKQAEKHLDQLPAPTEEDMKWLADEWTDIYYPNVQSLRPILARYRDQHDLMMGFPEHLCRRLDFEIGKSAVMRDMPSFLRVLLGKDESNACAIVRRELSLLTEYDVLDPVREFLRCYSDNKPTVEGHLCWFNALLARGPELVWQHISGLLQAFRKHESKTAGPFSESLDKMTATKIEAILLFMREHPGQLSILSIDLLDIIFDELLGKPRLMRPHVNFLIRLEKLFAERITAGESTLKPFVERLRQTLQKLAAPAGKPRKTRKGRR
ncbi:MAG: hypothetical protein AB9866_16375 [Syntrophobacteraceae bacterium]